jgi:hypothetical protein
MATLAPWEKPEDQTLAPWEQPDAAFNPAEPTSDSIDPSTLAGNSDWKTASRIIYQMNNGSEFEGSDADLAEYGLDQMGWFNYNLPRMSVDAVRIQYASEDQRKAFLHLMDTYDELEMSWGGAGRFIKGAAADPTTYVGLASLGFGTAAAQGTKIATKQGIKELLKVGARTAVVGGVEGAVYGGATSAARQSVEVAGGAREDISGTQLLADAGVGAVGGAVLGGAIGVVGGAVRNRSLPSAGSVAPNVGGVAPNATPATPSPAPVAAGMAPQASQSPVQPGSAVPGSQVPPAANAAPAPSNPLIQSVPGATQVQDVIAALKKAAPDDTVGNVPRNRIDLLKASEEAYDALVRLGIKGADDALDLFQKMPRSPDQNTLLKVSTQQAAETVTKARADYLKIANSSGSTPAERQDAVDALIKLSPIQKNLAELDAKLSSPSGTDLGSRKGGKLVNDNRNLSPETILKEDKIDPAQATPQQVRDAETEFVRRWDELETIMATNQEMKVLEKKIVAAKLAGNLTEVMKLLSERDAVLTQKLRQKNAKKSTGSKLYEAFNDKIVRKATEYVISTVFSPATIVANVVPAAVKTIYKPALNAAMKGFGKSARAEMAHTYSAMWAAKGAAYSAAKAAFRYERALLTGDFDKVLEQEPAIKGLKGRIIRFFPRSLAATDEYFGRIIYQGYIAGNAATQAADDAIARGLKGAAYDKSIKDAVDKAVKNAYEIDANQINVMDLLRQRGMDRGYKGKRLELWMKTELDKNEDLFKQAVDKAGRDYTDDMLFKRAFTRKGTVSEWASNYERFVNKNPSMRFVQLFIRTPIRVFEEGIRLTPGFQLIAPNFTNDLLGKNGVQKQVRAQGEMMLSYALTTSVIGMYAAGTITGGGPSDYKQRRGKEYAKEWEPYTITLPNGSKLNYRNLDPFATPIKIMTNVLDRLHDLEYRKSQGEKVDGLMENTWQYAQVAVLSGIQAIRDASLTTGIDQIGDFIEALGAEDQSGVDKITKFFSQKAAMFVPGVVTKTQDFLNSNPEMRDPATLEQFVYSKINPASDINPRRYNNIGLPVALSNPGAALFGPFITNTKEKQMRGLSETDQYVLAGLSDLERANDTNFVMPYKMPGIDLDLRRELTSDGKETYWDRLNSYVYEMGITDALAPLFEEGMGTLGTAAVDGTKTEAVRSILNDFRKAAFYRLMSEENSLSEEFYRRKVEEAEARAGMYDAQPR